MVHFFFRSPLSLPTLYNVRAICGYALLYVCKLDLSTLQLSSLFKQTLKYIYFSEHLKAVGYECFYFLDPQLIFPFRSYLL